MVVQYYENTDEIDLYAGDPRYNDIEWDVRLLSKVSEIALERQSQILQRHVDEIIREMNAEKKTE